MAHKQPGLCSVTQWLCLSAGLPAYESSAPCSLLCCADITPLQVLNGSVEAPREMQPLYGLLNAELLQVERGEGLAAPYAQACPCASAGGTGVGARDQPLLAECPFPC